MRRGSLSERTRNAIGTPKRTMPTDPNTIAIAIPIAITQPT